MFFSEVTEPKLRKNLTLEKGCPPHNFFFKLGNLQNNFRDERPFSNFTHTLKG
jgi:hypothetical protein